MCVVSQHISRPDVLQNYISVDESDNLYSAVTSSSCRHSSISQTSDILRMFMNQPHSDAVGVNVRDDKRDDLFQYSI